MFLKNAWYCAGWDSEVEGDTLLARRVLGVDLVFFRGEDGRAAVLEEAVNDALPRLYSEAVQSEELDVIAQPEVDITSFTDATSQATAFTYTSGHMSKIVSATQRRREAQDGARREA